MNKDFEKGYKELRQQEAPDLWNRIEAGLSEKKEPVPAAVIKKFPAVKKKTLVYASTIAACLCLLIAAVPYMFGNFSSSDDFAPSEAAATAEEPAMDNVVVADEVTAEEPAEAPVADADAWEEDGVDMTAEQTTNAGAADSIIKGGGDNQDDAMADENNLRDEADTSSELAFTEQEKAEEEVMDTGYAFDNVNILIKSVESTLNGEVFIATVLNDPNGHFSANQEIRVCISNDEFPDFEMNTAYTVSLLDENAETAVTKVYIVNGVK